MARKVLSITVRVKYVAELPEEQKAFWDSYYQKLIAGAGPTTAPNILEKKCPADEHRATVTPHSKRTVLEHGYR